MEALLLSLSLLASPLPPAHAPQELEVQQIERGPVIPNGVIAEKILPLRPAEGIDFKAIADLAKALSGLPGKVSEAVERWTDAAIRRIERAITVGIAIGLGLPLTVFAIVVAFRLRKQQQPQP